MENEIVKPDEGTATPTPMFVHSFPQPSVSTVKDVQDWLEVAEKAIVRSPRVWIAGRILTLLKHYYIDHQEPASLTRAIARDWITTLERYCPTAIDYACVQFLTRGTKKPKISQIVEIAAAWEMDIKLSMRRARLIIEPPPDNRPFKPLPTSGKARLDSRANLSEKHAEEEAERKAKLKAEAEEIEAPARNASPSARASLRKAQLENRLMFPPETMSIAHAAELRALKAWAKGEAEIPKEFLPRPTEPQE